LFAYDIAQLLNILGFERCNHWRFFSFWLASFGFDFRYIVVLVICLPFAESLL